MSVEDLIKQFVPTINVMQLATSSNDQPWVCNLHFFSDENLSMYWLSTPQRRHSEEIAKNPKVSAALKVHENTPREDYVIGISFEGMASVVEERKLKQQLATGYGKKLGISDKFLSEVLSGENPHQFYCLKPSRIVLFDNKNFPGTPRQEWNLDA